jgi:hypothetical protein
VKNKLRDDPFIETSVDLGYAHSPKDQRSLPSIAESDIAILRESEVVQTKDNNYITRMAGLQESILIKKILMVMAPLAAVGVLAVFFPWINAVLPN